MFKRNKRSRHIVPLTLAVTLLAASLAEIPPLHALTLADRHAGDTTRPTPDLVVPHYPSEPFAVSQSGFELISNHLR